MSKCFWTMKSRKGFGIPHLCPWDFETFDYDGICSHFPINEAIFGTSASGTPEEARSNTSVEYHKLRSRTSHTSDVQGARPVLSSAAPRSSGTCVEAQARAIASAMWKRMMRTERRSWMRC